MWEVNATHLKGRTPSYSYGINTMQSFRHWWDCHKILQRTLGFLEPWFLGNGDNVVEKKVFKGLIILLFKNGNKKDLNNLRIIALINMSNKIYVKVLQRYLQPIFVNIMNMNQLTFLLLKYILDDIVLIHEMLDCTRKLEQSLAFLELDYSKVF